MIDDKGRWQSLPGVYTTLHLLGKIAWQVTDA